MASKTFTKAGIVLSAILFVAAVTCMIIVIVQSGPESMTRTVVEYTPVETRAAFSDSVQSNLTSVVLSPADSSKWGEIPGDFQTTYRLSVAIETYTSNNDFSDGPQVVTGDPVAVDVHPTMTWAAIEEGEVEYGESGTMVKTVTATPTYDIPQAEKDAMGSAMVETLNYGALSTWYKLQNAPIYKKAWQVWAQVTDKMFTQSFQTYFYSLVAWYNYYDDQATVVAALQVAPISMTATEAANVYIDDQCGMSTYKSLTYWAAAALAARGTAGGSGSTAYVDLQDYYLVKYSYKFTDAQIDGIVGTGSVMAAQIDTLEALLVANPSKTGYENLSVPVPANPLAMVQWSQQTLLGTNLDFWVNGNNDPVANPLGDVYQNCKDLDMSFNVPPEFIEAGAISVEQALNLSMNSGYVSNDNSLLYPMNMYTAFYDYATTGLFTSLDAEQTNYLVDWFTEQLTYNTEQAQGTFIAKSVESSYAFLLANFANEVAARNLGYQINVEQTATTMDCAYFMTQAGISAADYATTCAAYDFSDLVSLRVFVNAIMDGTAPATEATTVGLSEANMVAFNAIATTGPDATGTFGTVLQYILNLQSTTWQCVGFQNLPPALCTPEELAPYQWGASYYTQNPIFSTVVSGNGFLDNTAYSMCDWGTYTFPGCAFPPEYAAYASEPYYYRGDAYLTLAQSVKVLSTDYSWFGLQNIYNGMRIFEDYETVKKDYVSPTQYWVDTYEFYGMESSQLQLTLKFLEWQSAEWLTGGVTSTYSQLELVQGFETDFVDKINTGAQYALLQGNIFVDPMVTPYINLWQGPTANRRITLLQGVGADGTVTPDDAASVYEIDSDGAHIWLNQKLWTGADWVDVKWYNEAIGMTYLYNPAGGVSAPCSLKVPIKNSLDMSTQSLVRGFSLETFGEYAQVYQFSTKYCGQGSQLGADCYQEFTAINYSAYALPGNLNYWNDALNMPVKGANYANQQEIDQAQGWTTQFINTFQLELLGGERFFTSDTDDAPVMIATIDTWIFADQGAYMDAVIPNNGTAQWPTGDHTEEYSNPRKAGAIVGIVTLAILVFVSILCVIAFCKLHHDGAHGDAAKVAYRDGETDGLVDSDPQL